MNRNPFDPPFDRLPDNIPVFPLAGVLLLPRGKLPLNIFEPRYLNMIQDALASDRMIGIIQPSDAAGANTGKCPPLLPLGCVGRITSFAETDDGRFLITLTGLIRFGLQAELATTRGYRRVVPDYTAYALDLTEDEAEVLDRDRLDTALKTYFRRQGITADWKAIADTPDERLVATLGMICPFEPQEKQALLEAADLPTRADLLLALLEMSAHEKGGGDQARH